jgi:PhnB protein
MAVTPIPEGYSAPTPYLIVKGAARAIEFYKKAFGATETHRFAGPDGTIGHAEIRLDGHPVMLADEFPDMGVVGPESLGGTAVSLLHYVKDVDDSFRKAIAAGAKELRPVKDQFYGDRSGTLKDPFGHVWTLASRKEDVPDAEMRKRHDEFMKQMAAEGKKGGA